MPDARLECFSPEAAQAVAREADKPGQHHRARAEGPAVVLTYHDARYPLDVAERAFNNGHCDDDVTGRL